jgi:hypothetical protein
LAGGVRQQPAELMACVYSSVLTLLSLKDGGYAPSSFHYPLSIIHYRLSFHLIFAELFIFRTTSLSGKID